MHGGVFFIFSADGRQEDHSFIARNLEVNQHASYQNSLILSFSVH